MHVFRLFMKYMHEKRAKCYSSVYGKFLLFFVLIKDDSDASSQIPRTINIHLEPKSEYAFCRIHRLAQNPYLNIEIPTSQTVKYFIDFLENKWKNRHKQVVSGF